uniref:Complex 1 LYR protein domain-containing protein n=1 Tax=Glossina morsitans morsitans TaxID=37546 RepID=A0ABK9MIC2_GLOMM
MATRRLVLSMYRELLREAEKLPTYNFRMYALRKIKDSYRANSKISDFDKIKELVGVAKYNLALINRQVIIGHLYSAEKLVIEKKPTLDPLED